ncbi:hypothetical protein [Flavobacterium sp.]|uniref:hypothetical protein n=1 Tax=Flavobacterium sp. TaxID=239 RepID=UPI003D6A6E72
METDKYYTPEIEEFHVGFEYENQHDRHHIFNWEDKVFKKSSKLSKIKQKLLENKIRVAYLDKENIESLGWIQRDYDTYDIEGYALELNNEYHTYIYQTGPHNGTVFKGIIKNKSELKRLMQQLKIQNA